MRRRLLSLFLIVVLILGMLTLVASAEATATIEYLNSESGT